MSVNVARVWFLIVSFAFASYAVQLGAFKTKRQALQQQTILAEKGIETVVRYTQHWHKVYYGPFEKKKGALEAQRALQKKGFPGFVAQVPASWFGGRAEPKPVLEGKLHKKEKKGGKEKKIRKGVFKIATFSESSSAMSLLKKLREKKVTSFILVRRVKEKKFYIVVVYGKESVISKAAKDLLLSTSLLYGE